jgi:hypothetical protein
MSLEMINSGRRGMSRNTSAISRPNRNNSVKLPPPIAMPTMRSHGANRDKIGN